MRYLEAGGRLLGATLAAVLAAGCGGTPAPSVEPGDDGDGGGAPVVAPACDEVEPLRAELPEDQAPTGTTAEPSDDVPVDDPDGAATVEAPPDALDLAPSIEAWARREAPDTFAGVWLDHEVGGFAVAFSDDVEDSAAAIREGVHPGIAVADAANSEEELWATHERLRQEPARDAGAAPQDGGAAPGDLTGWGTGVLQNRVTIGVYEPDEARLAELSARYGADLICFEIEREPGPQDAVPAPFRPADDADLAPEATTVEVLVQERECASGASAEGRIVELDVSYGDDEVVATLGVIPRPGGQDCQGNPDTPYTLELDEPLGGRALLDGSLDPPGPPVGDP